MDPERFIPLLAAAFTIEYDQMVDSADLRYGRRLSLLQEALRLRPSDTGALVRLIEFADGGGDGDDIGSPQLAVAEETLEVILARGEVPAAAHLALGTKAWAGRRRGGRNISSRAGLPARPVPSVWWSTTSPGCSLTAATLTWTAPLRLIDSTVERWAGGSDLPRHPGRGAASLREERGGAIRARTGSRRGDWSSPRLHATLAAVYAALDRQDLADRHRALAAGEEWTE